MTSELNHLEKFLEDLDPEFVPVQFPDDDPKTINKTSENSSVNITKKMSPHKKQRTKLALYNPFDVRDNITNTGYVHHFKMRNKEDRNKFAEDVIRTMKDRIKNVHGYPLRIVMFENTGTAVADEFDDDGQVTR